MEDLGRLLIKTVGIKMERDLLGRGRGWEEPGWTEASGYPRKVRLCSPGRSLGRPARGPEAVKTLGLGRGVANGHR